MQSRKGDHRFYGIEEIDFLQKFSRNSWLENHENRGIFMETPLDIQKFKWLF